MELKPYCSRTPAIGRASFSWQAVRRIRLFGVSVPEIIFLKRDRSKFRIGANRPQGHELPDLPQIAFVDQLDAHYGVVVKKGSQGWPGYILSLPRSPPGGRQRRASGHHTFSLRLKVPQVIFGKIGNGHMLHIPFHQQISDQMSAEEAFSACHHNASVFEWVTSAYIHPSTYLPYVHAGGSVILFRIFS